MKPIQECEIKIEKIEFYTCNQPYCTKVFLNLTELAKHEIKHYDEFQYRLYNSYVQIEKIRIYECDDCTRGFLYKKDYLLHKVKHIHQSIRNTKTKKYKLYENKGIEKPYECPECDYRFVAKSTLKAHSFVHKPFPYKCFCGIGYYQLKDLIRHQKLVHKQPKLEEIKPLNNNVVKKPKEIIKVKFSSKKKKRRSKKVGSNHSSPPVDILNDLIDNWTQLPVPPLNIDFPKTEKNKHKCPICKKLFSTKCSIEMHYRTVHRKERSFMCNVCSKTFTQKPALNLHLIKHSGVKAFKCNYCDKRFYVYANQIRHERIHTGERPYKCSFCDKGFNDPSAHLRHERIHTGDKRYRCEICPKAFTDHSSLYVHRKRHQIRKKDFPCSVCAKRFYTKYNLKTHFNRVHSLIKNFQCDHCKKYFSCKPYLSVHIKSHYSTKRKRFKCHICSKFYISLHNLQIHMRVVHKQTKKHACNYCRKQFSKKKLLKHHILRGSCSKTLKYECDYCAAIFGLKRLLCKHILKHMNILCKACSKYFSRSKDLEEHELKESEKCAICEKEFFCKDAMPIHLDVHKGIRFECNECGRVFAEKAKLYVHLQKYHTEPKYVCDHCGQRFLFKGDIRLHIKTHHLEVLRCHICYRGFYSNYEFRKHKNTGCYCK